MKNKFYRILCVLTILAIFLPSSAIAGKKKVFPPNSKFFQVSGHDAYLALPKGVKAGEKTPWLWYCPSDYNLPGRLEQWMMNKCLANGIAVAGINVKGDFGTPAGRKIFTAFYKELTTKHGLTKKVCMLARSYGGTQMYNWAAEHPESIACLAGIYPVCNLSSYPGIKSAAGKYGMTEEQLTKELKRHNPVDRLAPLAKWDVPIYHNTGDVDTLVPAKDNSFLVEKRYKELGGDINVTIFKGQGHNYWTGFFEDEAMAAFIIKHAKRVASLPKVLVFGDSICGGYSNSLIKFLDGKAEVVRLGAVATYRINEEAWWHSSGKAKALDFGSAKACVADLERFAEHLSRNKYDVIHFNFGLNDIFRGRGGAWHNPVDQYAKDLEKIVALLKSNSAKVIWASTTPIPANCPNNPEGDELIYNAAAEKVMKENNIPINDLHSVITKWDGYDKWKQGDNVHFSGDVYSKLAEQIAEVIVEQIETPGINETGSAPLNPVLGSENLKLDDLRCEYLVNPLGVDVAKPRLSWKLESNQRGQKQAAYCVLVASSRDKLDKNTGDLWDTGKVKSNQSLNVIYGGELLESRQRYFWKVRVWDSSGRESIWSKPACWGMEILDQNQWQGAWIQSDLFLYDYQVELKKVAGHELEVEKMENGGDIRVRGKEVRKMTAEITEAPAVWMRKEFQSEDKKLRKATLFISGLGLYEAYINGRKINDHLVNVAPHDFSKTVPYHVHDVTDFIEKGENALGVILGNGYFNPVVPSLLREYAFDFIDTPKLKCELQLEYEDGSTQLIVSDPSWKFTTDGPIRFNSIRSGETYDGRKELGDWSVAGFDDKYWKTARVAKGPAGRLASRTLPPVRVLKSFPAVSVKGHEKGYRFDIAVQSTGWARIKVRGKPGQKIVIKYPGEGSHTLGRYQTCEYICKGDGNEFYEPRFAFNGYRYIDVYGLDYTPELTDVVGRQVVSDLQTVGSFACSDEQLNILQQVNLRTIQNYNVAMPLDPVREKVCWTQDVQSNFETSAYNFDLYEVYSKWQDDYVDSVLENGFVPTVVPSCFDGPTINGPWWGGMLIFNPWQLYNFYGDKEILFKSYEAMKKHMSYYDSIAKDNIVSWGLGDWQDAGAQKRGYGRPAYTTVPYTSTCAYFNYANILRQTAFLTGKQDESAYYKDKMEVIRKSLHEKFYDPQTGVYDKGSQTAYVLALRLNIALEKDRPRIVENLKKQIASDDYHLTSGFVGLPFLLPELTETGLGDLAWKIATQETYPSWYDMIFNEKKTAFMEAWDGGMVQMPSLAGPIGAWFYRSLGGIRADEPGFKRFIVEPYTKTLDWVKCQYESPYGAIISNWSKQDGIVTMNVTVPVNTTATVYVDGQQVTESGKPAKQANGVTFLRMENDKAVFKVQSGTYEFKSVLK